MMKSVKRKGLVVLLGVAIVLFGAANGVIAGGLEPDLDLDFAVMVPGGTATVTADLIATFPIDLQVLPVVAIGDMNLVATMSRSGPPGELLVLLQVGTGRPEFDVRVGPGPGSVKLTTRSEAGYAVVLFISGVISTTSTPPYAYNVALSS